MDHDLRDRLVKTSERLHERAIALSHPGRDTDMALLLSATALTMEALRVLADDAALAAIAGSGR